MSRRVEIRPAAERDLVRLAAFLEPLSERVALRRSRALRERLRKLGDQPFIGRPGPSDDLREIVMRFGRSSYLARYQITPSAVIILRIWHGAEDRPR